MMDRMRYLVISNHKEGPIIWEIQTARMGRDDVMEDIRLGQYGEVLHVIEWNAIEGICRDVTEEFATQEES